MIRSNELLTTKSKQVCGRKDERRSRDSLRGSKNENEPPRSAGQSSVKRDDEKSGFITQPLCNFFFLEFCPSFYQHGASRTYSLGILYRNRYASRVPGNADVGARCCFSGEKPSFALHALETGNLTSCSGLLSIMYECCRF